MLNNLSELSSLIWIIFLDQGNPFVENIVTAINLFRPKPEKIMTNELFKVVQDHSLRMYFIYLALKLISTELINSCFVKQEEIRKEIDEKIVRAKESSLSLEEISIILNKNDEISNRIKLLKDRFIQIHNMAQAQGFNPISNAGENRFYAYRALEINMEELIKDSNKNR